MLIGQYMNNPNLLLSQKQFYNFEKKKILESLALSLEQSRLETPRTINPPPPYVFESISNYLWFKKSTY
jgi:hypothetical protein